VFAVGVLGGALAAVAVAGIGGSTLVPLLALRIDLKYAVAISTVPHLLGGLVTHSAPPRDRSRRADPIWFLCAIASLTGALVHSYAGSAVVTYFFAVLVLAGIIAALGLAEHLRFPTQGRLAVRHGFRLPRLCGRAGWTARGRSARLRTA
jgi:hypothetical protein